MNENTKPEEGTQPEAGAHNAPPSEGTDSTPRASDLDVTAAAPAEDAPAPTSLPPALAAAAAPKANPVMRGKVPTVPATAPLYRVRAGAKPHFINGRIVGPKETVRFAGVPGRDLEPMDDAAKEKVAAAQKARDAKKAEADKLRIDRNKLIKALKGL